MYKQENPTKLKVVIYLGSLWIKNNKSIINVLAITCQPLALDGQSGL